MFLADTGLDDIVVDHHHKHLNEPDEALGSIAVSPFVAVPASAANKDEEHKQHYNPKLYHVLSKRDVKLYSLLLPVDYLTNLAVVFALRGNIESFILAILGMVEPGGRKAVPAAIVGHEDYRQGNRDVRLSPCGNVPLMGIAGVAQNNFLHINLAFLLVSIVSRHGGNHQQQ